MLALYMYVSSITAHTAGPNWLKFLREFSKLFFYHTGHFSCFFLYLLTMVPISLYFFFSCPLFFLLELVSVLFIIHLSYRCIVRTVNFTYDVDRQVLGTFQIPQLFKFKFFQISSILFILTKKGAFNIVKNVKLGKLICWGRRRLFSSENISPNSLVSSSPPS